MVITNISWVCGLFDLHLIPGAKIEPSIGLLQEDDNEWHRASDHIDNVIINFNPRALFVPIGGDELSGWGLTLNKVTGSLKVVDAFPVNMPRLYNFILEMDLVDNRPVIPVKKHSAVRIHIHDSIESAWLTPSSLGVPKDTDNYRFSILAQFNNHIAGRDYPIIGDVSRYPEIEWESANNGFVEVDPNNGNLKTIHSPAIIRITAKFKNPPYNVKNIRSADVSTESSWSLLSGNIRAVGVPPGEAKAIRQARIKNFPNILFIPEGFKRGQELDFEKLVDRLVKGLRTMPSLYPFDSFTRNNKINFWTAFIPSMQEGISVHHLMNQGPDKPNPAGGFKTTGKLDENFPPLAIKPNIASIEKWTLQEMIYVVGLPTRFDKDQKPENVPTFEHQVLNSWIDRFNRDDILPLRPGTPPIDDWKRKVDTDLWKKWKKLGDYLLADEMNSAIGLEKGFRPNVFESFGQTRTIKFHPSRTKMDHLDKFLENLKADVDIDPIGNIWCPVDPPDPAHPDKGKDRGRVVALCKGAPASGAGITKGQELIRVSIGNSTEVILNHNPPSLEYEIVPHILPKHADLSSISINRIIHELGHSLRLLDEYGGGDSLSNEKEEEIKELKLVGNLQFRDDLVSGITGFITTNILKWKWHRIKKIGVLVNNLTPLGPNKFKVTLQPGQAQKFKKDEVVFLRQRPLIQDPPALISRELKVFEEPTGDDVVVEGFLNTVNFSGGVLFVPKSDAVGPELIVHRKILNKIDISGGPLNTPFNDPRRDCITHIQSQAPREHPSKKQIPKNLPDLSHLIANKEKIIGLYDGGKTYYCNVYHPAGMCLMRSLGATNFCHVCRYILVDIIDPLMHEEIDNKYDGEYSKI